MTDDQRLFQTTSAREDNPKAVFYGTEEKIITPLALYLIERSVELYAAKGWSDALFGNYFFYVGDVTPVKPILEESGGKLPKTLLLLTGNSDVTGITSLLERLPQVKAVCFGQKKEIDATEAETVLAFFFGADEQVLTLSTEQIAAKKLPESRPVAQVEKPQETAQVVAEPHIGTPLEVTARIPEAPTSVIDSETKNTLESIFTGQPKPTRPPSAGSISARVPLFKASIIVLVVLVIFPLFTLGVELSLGCLNLFFTYKSWQETNLPAVDKNLQGARFFFRVAEVNLKPVWGLFAIVRQERLYRQLYQLVTTAGRISQGSLYLVAAAGDGETLIQGITGREKGISFGQVIASVKGNLTLADTQMGLVEAELKTESLRDFFSGSRFSFLRDSYPGISNRLSRLRQAVAAARSMLAVVPEVTAFYGTRTYLVVFQNNMELRPTGGFIGSYALVHFADGVLKEYVIEDVYEADGALKGHVEPPEPIKTHLGTEHWYLRDANWDPDFSRTGARLAWFLDKEIEVAVDGVIAVDLTFVQSLLEAMGPLPVAPYPEKITADTLFTTAQETIETDFFPGSSQKKDFLGAVGRTLILSLLENEDISHVGLFEKVREGITSRHLLVYFVNPGAQELAESLGWTGSFGWPFVCARTCIPDFLSVVDANLGVNKVNYYVTRKFSDDVEITDEGQVVHTLTITYKNDSTDTATKIGGTYKNYVRVYTPFDTELTGASFDSLPMTIETGNVASGSAITVTSEGNLRVFSGLIEVPPKQEKKLTLTYGRQASVSPADQLTYAYQVQKQAGTDADGLHVTVRYPPSWQLVSRFADGEVSGATTIATDQQISYNTGLVYDTLLETEFRIK